jgi:hypothetical protein
MPAPESNMRLVRLLAILCSIAAVTACVPEVEAPAVPGTAPAVETAPATPTPLAVSVLRDGPFELEDIDVDTLPVEEAVLLPPPQVPPPITRRHPAKVIVHIEVTEEVREIADARPADSRAPR